MDHDRIKAGRPRPFGRGLKGRDDSLDFPPRELAGHFPVPEPLERNRRGPDRLRAGGREEGLPSPVIDLRDDGRPPILHRAAKTLKAGDHGVVVDAELQHVPLAPGVDIEVFGADERGAALRPRADIPEVAPGDGAVRIPEIFFHRGRDDPVLEAKRTDPAFREKPGIIVFRVVHEGWTSEIQKR